MSLARSLGAAALVGVFVGLSGCASKACCGPTGPERAWVPERTETRLEYGMVPAETRMKTVEIPCLRREPVTIQVQEPVYEEVRVADTRRALAPTTERVRVPKMGYQEVEDTQPVLRGVCQVQCVPVEKCATVVTLGIGCQSGGFRVVADAHRETVTRNVRRVVKIGEHVVQIPAGTHLEQVAVGAECKEIATGAHEVECVTGSHVEQRQVDTVCRTVTVGERTSIAVRDTVQVPVVTRPAHWGTQERQVTVPGRWVRICASQEESNGFDVVTRDEYQRMVGATAP